ncbi:testis-expressed protein 9 isoform X2 [Cimex lectularius]|uniref:Uncharacterized protein n=1 Tax=Cimex lectularius TaxID=79782 RepID=A0A8I6S8F9_CIMLE|nr:testis-expressed protein 9 isoform X2 [Cimex lectularius]
MKPFLTDYENVVKPRGRELTSSSCGYKSPMSDVTSDLSDLRYEKKIMTVSSMLKKNAPVRKKLPANESTLDCGDLIPMSTKGLSAESVARFLKAKGKMLQEELANTKRELTKKTDDWKRIQKELKDSEDQRIKLASDLMNAREKIKRQEGNLNTINERLSMRDSENAFLKKEVEMLKQDLKKINQQYSNNDVKLNKAKEEVEKFKNLLKMSQLNEKEAKEKYRAKEEEMNLTVNKLERHKNALLSAIKKQVYLIDNLKTQKAYLELNGITNYCEEEFLRLLNWRPNEV